MGQKVNPVSFRLGDTRSWDAHWYAPKKNFAANLLEDINVRKHILKHYRSAAVSRVVMERSSDKVKVNIYTARPGVIIGRRGADIDKMRNELLKLVGKDVQINIKEIKNPAIDAQLLAENIAVQLEKRIAFRRAMKKTMQQARESGAKGMKVYTKGRLGGAEIARKEGYHDGAVPLHTLRANVDYGFAEAKTTYGIIGVKVWLYKGDFMKRPDLFGLNGGDITTLGMGESVKSTPNTKRNNRDNYRGQPSSTSNEKIKSASADKKSTPNTKPADTSEEKEAQDAVGKIEPKTKAKTEDGSDNNVTT